MPITSKINDQEKRIYTVCTGIITMKDFDYYLDVTWGNPAISGYSELFDTRDADWAHITHYNLMEVARRGSESSVIDPSSRFAWLVDNDSVKMLTDFYKNAKMMQSSKSRILRAFQSRDDALQWLDE